MYCIQCGAQNSETTRFCSRCGANLASMLQALAAPEPSSDDRFELESKHIFWLMVLTAMVALGGFGILFGAIIALATKSTLPPGDLAPALIALALFGTGGICFVVGMLLRMITKSRIRSSKPRHERPRPEPAQAPLQQQLPAPSFVQQVPPSVVDHTTAHLPKYAPPAEDRAEAVERDDRPRPTR